MDAEVIAELRGRCAALESLVTAILIFDLKTRPERERLVSFLAQAEARLSPRAVAAMEQDAAREAQLAKESFRRITLQVLANIPEELARDKKN